MADSGGQVSASAALDLQAILHLQRSGLFDGAWFLTRNPDLAKPGADPLGHFHRWGWREGRWPNAYFDPDWYLAQNKDVRESGVDPLLHYALFGEAQGRSPIAWFDPVWYRGFYGVPPETLCLAHFLLHRTSGAVSPIPEFDAVYYCANNPDIAAIGMDPFEHYIVQGAREGRVPSAEFDPEFYARRYLRNQPDTNPLLHYRAHRHQPGIVPRLPPDEKTVANEIRHFTRPGPFFEPLRPPVRHTAPRARILAFYLPQFHAIPENDSWWGTGFTEWTNAARAIPRFVGHYQPRIPRDLGHYSLDDVSVLRRQAEMARGAGIHGFVFYFYWFDGKRLLEKPLEALLADPSIDLPFCLMWANENWTRRWDGSEDEILIEQSYRGEDDAALVATFLRHFADPRYIRLQRRPVLMVYRAGHVPEGAVARWRRRFAEAGENPVFVMAQSFNDRDPRLLDMDAAVEFPPHKFTDRLPKLNPTLEMLDHDATMRVFAYQDVIAASDLAPSPFPLIRTVLPGWDNDARRQGAGMALLGATPSLYQSWLEQVIDAARVQPVFGEALVCINAWNEWGEGAYLEPDLYFGAAFLNATTRAVTGVAASSSARVRILLVGHDAHPSGAQLLLLHLGQVLKSGLGVDVAFLLLGDGALVPRYQAAAPTTLLPGASALPSHLASLQAQGFAAAIVNSSASAEACVILNQAGIACTLLVHEMPRLMRERQLIEHAQAASAVARRIVFACEHVRDRFAELVQLPPDRVVIAPQGIYRPIQATDRAARRARLRIPDRGTLAIGLGYADLRKGFDLFLQVWRTAHARDPSIHMLWVGDLDPGVQAYLGAEMAAAEATGTFHHIPFSGDGGDWLVAADVLLLTSREDPFPTIVLEAMSVGVPTVAFEESGGIPDLLRECRAGTSVPLGNVPAMTRQLRAHAVQNRPAARQNMIAQARQRYDFDRYASRLLHLACPELHDISVVVPNYNYAPHLAERLESIFAQTVPVSEVIVLDDASTDDSETVARQTAARAGRRLRWVGAAHNSGSVFRQWRRAALLARSEWLWLAEADDSAHPDFLAALSAALHPAPDAVMAFTDSAAIDAQGATLWPDHQAYYRDAGAEALTQDSIFDAPALLRTALSARNLLLNVSAVLWRRDALLAALDRCGAELESYRLAGDWRLYAEVLAAGGQVAYVARPLNRHRRHAASVTGRLDDTAHLDEIGRMHRHLRTVLGNSPGLAARQNKALAAARQELAASRPVKASRAARRRPAPAAS